MRELHAGQHNTALDPLLIIGVSLPIFSQRTSEPSQCSPKVLFTAFSEKVENAIASSSGTAPTGAVPERILHYNNADLEFHPQGIPLVYSLSSLVSTQIIYWKLMPIQINELF